MRYTGTGAAPERRRQHPRQSAGPQAEDGVLFRVPHPQRGRPMLRRRRLRACRLQDRSPARVSRPHRPPTPLSCPGTQYADLRVPHFPVTAAGRLIVRQTMLPHAHSRTWFVRGALQRHGQQWLCAGKQSPTNLLTTFVRLSRCPHQVSIDLCSIVLGGLCHISELTSGVTCSDCVTKGSVQIAQPSFVSTGGHSMSTPSSSFKVAFLPTSEMFGFSWAYHAIADQKSGAKPCPRFCQVTLNAGGSPTATAIWARTARSGTTSRATSTGRRTNQATSSARGIHLERQEIFFT